MSVQYNHILSISVQYNHILSMSVQYNHILSMSVQYNQTSTHTGSLSMIDCWNLLSSIRWRSVGFKWIHLVGSSTVNSTYCDGYQYLVCTRSSLQRFRLSLLTFSWSRIHQLHRYKYMLCFYHLSTLLYLPHLSWHLAAIFHLISCNIDLT